MAHGDWDRFGKVFYNYHKRMFGVKLEVAVATQRRPVPIATRVVPAGQSDIRIAREGIFQRMEPGERALGDPGYQGEPNQIYAPPRRGMRTFVADLDKAELTLQRRVEMANQRIKSFKCVGTTYRKGAVHAYQELQLLGTLVPKLILLDMICNPEHTGNIHVTGPSVQQRPSHQRRPQLCKIGKKPQKKGALVYRQAVQPKNVKVKYIYKYK